MLRTAFIFFVLAAASCSISMADTPTHPARPHRRALAHVRSVPHSTPHASRSTAHRPHPAARPVPRHANEREARERYPSERHSSERYAPAHHPAERHVSERRVSAYHPSARAAISHPPAVIRTRRTAARSTHPSASPQPDTVRQPNTDREPDTGRDPDPDPTPAVALADPASDLAPDPGPTALTRRHLPMPPPLTGSLASLERQNQRSDAEGLERILDDDDLNDRIARHMLVPVPVSEALTVNPDLPPNHRYCRPWTARFLRDIALAHDAAFHRPLEVSSAVRTVAYQKRLMRVNGNAAAAEGDIVSPHLTGATIDIAKSGLTLPEIAWMRTRLLAFQLAGKIDVEEEFQQACFHITVYKSYVPAPVPRPRRRIPPPSQLASRGR